MKTALKPTAAALALALCACATAPPHSPAGAGRDASSLRHLEASNRMERRWSSVYEGVLGLPYRAGGGDRQGFDCSGLVQYAYRQFDGRSLPRTTRDLYRHGRAVAEPHTGDLLFYGTHGRKPTHVGIYLWDGWFLHATPARGVTLSSIREQYYTQRFVGARRLP